MKVLLLVLASLLLIAFPAGADDSLTSLRCNSGVISIGASKLELVSSCGQPSAKGTVDRRVSSSTNRAEYVQIEEWTYNFGSSDFIYVMEIDGTKLIGIKRGGRGF